MKHTINFLALFIAFLGCQTGFSQKNAIAPIVNPFDNNVWLSELQQDTAEMKANWLKRFGYSIRDNTDGGLTIFQKGDDPSTMKVIPVINYVIRSKSLIAWNERDPIEKLLELSSDMATCYIVDGKNIKCFIDYKRKDNKWEPFLYAKFEKETAEIISSVYFEKNECIIYINVEHGDGEYPSRYISPVYKENGNYITLHKYRTVSPLLINSLINYRRDLIDSLETGNLI